VQPLGAGFDRARFGELGENGANAPTTMVRRLDRDRDRERSPPLEPSDADGGLSSFGEIFDEPRVGPQVGA
jgi:hypothetical protein